MVLRGGRRWGHEVAMKAGYVMNTHRQMTRTLIRFRLRSVLAYFCAFAVFTVSAQVASPRQPGPVNVDISAALGALILSPLQRRNLEAARNTDGREQALLVDPSRETSTNLPDALVVSGVVVRSGNRSTVWVNDQPLYGLAEVDPLRTLAGQVGVLQRGTQNLRLKARAGQVIDVPSGQAVDLLPLGAIRIIQPKAVTATILKGSK